MCCAGNISRHASRPGRGHGSLGSQGGEGGDVSVGDEQWRPHYSHFLIFQQGCPVTCPASESHGCWGWGCQGSQSQGDTEPLEIFPHHFFKSGHRCWGRTESFQVCCDKILTSIPIYYEVWLMLVHCLFLKPFWFKMFSIRALKDAAAVIHESPSALQVINDLSNKNIDDVFSWDTFKLWIQSAPRRIQQLYFRFQWIFSTAGWRIRIIKLTDKSSATEKMEKNNCTEDDQKLLF